MNLEELLAKINAFFFLKEFSFTKNQFSPEPGKEVEFADHVVWIGDLMFLFQLKNREQLRSTTPEMEERWFKSKVLKKATRQIKDTLQYLDTCSAISIQNQLGEQLTPSRECRFRASIVLYLAHRKLPHECRMKKFHLSKDAGFIHIFPAHDYLGVCQNLITPAEVAEYFKYRECILREWGGAEKLSEQSLVGHFVGGNSSQQPKGEDSKFLNGIASQFQGFSLHETLAGVRGSIYFNSSSDPSKHNSTTYYKIIEQFLLLNRSEMFEIKKRFNLAISACEKNEFVRPYLVVCPRTECGFVIVPLQKQFLRNRWKALRGLTDAAKYDQGVPKMVGVSFVASKPHFLIDWCLSDGPWRRNSEIQAVLKENSPFRPVKPRIKDRYRPNQDLS